MLILFSLTLFLSAALLFVVEPMFGKMALPLLGGSPAVWNTCMVFYQGALLAGYLYAHLAPKWLGVRRQAAFHLGLLLLILFTLPIGIFQGWTPPPTANPVTWLLLLLLLSVGLPFFVVSSTAPLLQKWFAHTGHASSTTPISSTAPPTWAACWPWWPIPRLSNHTCACTTNPGSGPAATSCCWPW